jgi:hypothetical protein
MGKNKAMDAIAWRLNCGRSVARQSNETIGGDGLTSA